MPSPGTVALYLFSMLLLLALSGLYWPQLVLFGQSPVVRLRNCALFCVKHFGRVMGAGLARLAYIALLVLFAPWTLLLLPVTGVWYPMFLSQFLIYEQLDGDLHIEELFDRHTD